MAIAFNTVLGLFNLDDLFKDFSNRGLFGNLDLGDIFKGIGRSSGSLGGLDLGDIFKGIGTLGSLGEATFNSLLGNSLLGGVDTLTGFIDLFDPTRENLSGTSIADFLTNLGDLEVLNSLQLTDIFQGLDKQYYSVFRDLSFNNLLEDLSHLDLLGNPGKTDLLDGLGDVLNALGKSKLLNNFDLEDLVRGDGDRDLLQGLSSDDLILGLRAADQLLGARGEDLLAGGFGNDDLDGGRSDDILYGGRGVDTLTGGRGDDLFVVALGAGLDWVEDFTNSSDRIALLGNNLDLDELNITQQGSDTLVSYGRNKLAVLKDMDSDLVTAADFVLSSLKSRLNLGCVCFCSKRIADF
jgi:Ca2+-binding RTX toxin-like protein